MSLREVGVLYVFMVGLIYVGLRQGSLPEEFDMGFFDLFLYFFVLITLCTAAVSYVMWSLEHR